MRVWAAYGYLIVGVVVCVLAFVGVVNLLWWLLW
jgi:glycopeptide antibiotics resistance protein